MAKAKYEGIAKILVIIGGLIAIIDAISGFVSPGWSSYVGPIIALILGVIALLSAVKPDDPIPWNKLFLVILGIIMIILSAWYVGGILVLIGGILLFL